MATPAMDHSSDNRNSPHAPAGVKLIVAQALLEGMVLLGFWAFIFVIRIIGGVFIGLPSVLLLCALGAARLWMAIAMLRGKRWARFAEIGISLLIIGIASAGVFWLYRDEAPHRESIFVVSYGLVAMAKLVYLSRARVRLFFAD